MRFRVLLVALAVMTASVCRTVPAVGEIKPVVAVFNLNTREIRLNSVTIQTLTGYLASRLTAAGMYQVAPPSSVRRALIELKKESHNDCYDSFCQITIGQSIAANMILNSLVWRVGNRCSVNLDLYDVRTEAMVKSVEIPDLKCDTAGLKRGISLATAKLSGQISSTVSAISAEEGVTADKPGLVSPGKSAGGIQWVRIPGGTFQMGSNDGQSDEKPVHSVTVSAFEIAQTEVTVGQYKKCVEAGACRAPGAGGFCNWGKSGRDDHPVNCVDWHQASAYSKWAGARLCTEAEWEYAARSGGRNQKYPWGNDKASCHYAVMNSAGNGCGRNSTWPVCSKTAGNTLQGLCDMGGSVSEWVSDWYDSRYYKSRGSVNPTGPLGGSFRVSRGGGFGNYLGGYYFLRSSSRGVYDPFDDSAGLGLRCCRDVL